MIPLRTSDGKLQAHKYLDLPQNRITTFYKIVDKDKRMRVLKPNNIQQILLDNYDVRFKKILKARQEGVSTLEIIKLLDATVFNKNENNLILADCDKNIKKLFRIVQRAYWSMPQRFRPKLGRGGGSQYEYYFPEQNSRIGVALESRSETVNRLHISEAAFITNLNRIEGTIETVPIKTGFITYETTANGVGNHFYDFWNAKNGYKNFFFPWYFHKEYQMPVHGPLHYTDEELELIHFALTTYKMQLTPEQIAFRRWKKSSSKLFDQEYAETEERCFMTSGERVIDGDKIKQFKKTAPEPIKFNGSREDGFWFQQWEEYDRESYYVIGADVAEGVRKDYSSAKVLNARTRKEVACIASNNWKPSEFAEKIIWLASLYQHAEKMWPLVAVECNNHGHTVLQELNNANYRNLYYYADDRPGWKTDRVTRPILIDDFIDGVENQTVEFRDVELFNECLTLVDKNGKIEAADNKHDDRVISGAIAIQMLKQMDQIDKYVNLKSKIFV